MDLVLAVGLGVYLVASVGLLIYGLNAHIVTSLFLRGRRRARASEEAIMEAWGDPPDAALPVITTQLPIFNEKYVIERLLTAVCAIDWPRDKHEIQVLDDSVDETRELTARLVARLRDEGFDIHHIHRAERVGYKAGALAEGMAVARGEFIAIFDADFVPDPDFLHRTVPFLLADSRCAWVQTRWGHRNRDYSPLTYLQSIGIDGHFVVEQDTRATWGLFCNFNGTAGVWRKEAIADAGGWQPDTLTEDLDLSYRAMLRGWRSRLLSTVVTPAEIPTDINALKAQQRRWAKGSIQVALKLMPQVLADRRSGVFKKVQACLHLTHYMIHPLIMVLTLLALPLVQMLQGRFAETYTAPLLAIMVVALVGPSTLYVVAQAASGSSWQRALLWMPAMVCLGIGLAVNNSWAVLEGFMGKASEFVRTPKLGAVAESNARARATGAPPAAAEDAAPGATESREALAAAGGTTATALATDRTTETETGTAAPGEIAATGSEIDTGWKLYHAPLSRLVVVEILMGIWALTSFFGFLVTVGSAAGAVLLLQAIGFTVVGVLSLNHNRQLRGHRLASRHVVQS